MKYGFFGLVVGCSLGWWLASWLRQDRVEGAAALVTPAEKEPAVGRPEPVEPESAPRRSQEPAPPPQTLPESEPARHEVDVLFSSALLEHFRQEFRASWNEHRPVRPEPIELAEGEERFREEVLRLPASLARARADERNDADALEEAVGLGDGLILLSMAQRNLYRPDPEDVEWEVLDKALEPRSRGPVVDGPALAASDAHVGIARGATISFGPGVHRLNESKLRGEDRLTLPSDVTIAGAGMDATLLSIGDISFRGDVERLSFENLTLDAGNDGLFDMRDGALTLDLERVRVVRFDAAHGGCYVFFSRGALVRARDCEFIGGYGRAPGHGDLRRGSPFLARFARCRFELMDLGLQRSRPHDFIVFENCRFSLLEEDPRGAARKNILFPGSTFENPRTKDMTREDLKKDLSDLFWEFSE